MTETTQLQTDKAALQRSRIVTTARPPLQPGQALLRIHRLALTANNITYAAFGEVPHLLYWHFFPTGAEGWGQMPAWGFASVEASAVAGVAAGELFYGYWPIASHAVLQPVRVAERGFYDGTPHRLALNSAYNHYQRVNAALAGSTREQNFQALLWPLFITSFMLADFLQDNRFFGARQLLVSSASSKTAYGTVFCLRDQPSIDCIGLTSVGNRAFVDALGCYRRSLGYDEVESLDASLPTLYIDFAGDTALRQRVHHHFGGALVHSCYAGSAHSHDHLGAPTPSLPGPQPQPFFAPYQIKKRNADWGPGEVTRRFDAEKAEFIRRVDDPARPWMQVKEHAGFGAAAALIEALVAGSVDPKDGHVVVLD